MKRNLSLWRFAGFSLVSLAGTLLHFLYDWTNGSIFVAPFSAVNESTWEHMKLLYFPLLVFAIIQRGFFKEYENFWYVKLIGAALGLASIPVLFYTYNGAFGKSPDWVNIAIFFVSVAIVFSVETYLFRNDLLCHKKNKIAFFVLCFIGVLFIAFTFITPSIPIFMDPLTEEYGI